MQVFDIHAHVYPRKIAAKAAESIGRFYNFRIAYDGSPETLLRLGGADRYVIHSVATTPEQVADINDYIIREVSREPEHFTGFATLHPGMEHPGAELERALKAGLKGVKLHPDFQRFRADSPESIRLFRLCAELDCPVLIHAGDCQHNFSRPWMLLRALEACGGRLKLVCAHFAGWSEWMVAARYLGGSGIYVDTSSSCFALSTAQVRQLIALYGEDRVIFGSDYPAWNPGEEAQVLRDMGLGQAVEEKIFHRNLEKLLKME